MLIFRKKKRSVDLHQIDLSIPFTFKLENKVLFLLELSFLPYAIQPNIYIALSFIGKEVISGYCQSLLGIVINEVCLRLNLQMKCLNTIDKYYLIGIEMLK